MRKKRRFPTYNKGEKVQTSSLYRYCEDSLKRLQVSLSRPITFEIVFAAMSSYSKLACAQTPRVLTFKPHTSLWEIWSLHYPTYPKCPEMSGIESD